MPNLTPVPSFDDVYQLEVTDRVIGGPGGTSNVQAQALANRTAWLAQQLAGVATDAELAAAVDGLVSRASLSSSTGPTDGGALVGVSPSLSYAGGTVGKALRDRVWSITDAPWNALGNGTGNQQPAIVAAQTALAAAGGGTLLIPRGTFRITSAIPRVSNVDFAGLGWSSVLAPDGCGAFLFDYVAGASASSRTDNMYIEATNGGAQTAIDRPNRTTITDEVNNLSFSRLGVRGFNKCIRLQTARQVEINNCWFFDTNHAVHLVGMAFNVYMHHNIWVKAAGSGAGTSYGVKGEPFTYTVGGTAGPEGIRLDTNLNYAFEYCEHWTLGVEIRSTNLDMFCTRVGITVDGTIDYSASGGYFDCAGPNLQFGIYCPAQSVSNNTRYSFKDLSIHTVGGGIPANASGIMLGTRAVTGNVDGVSIERCTFYGWTGYDIEQYVCGHNVISNNTCRSTGTTQSISVTSCPAGRPTYVEKNNCTKTIVYDTADFNSGTLQLGTNVISGNVLNYGRAEMTSVAFNAANFTASGAMTWTVAAGDVATYAYQFDGRVMRLQFGLNTTTVGGTVGTELRIAVPGGLTIQRRCVNPVRILDNLVASVGFASATPGNTYVAIQRTDGANWTLSTDQTYVFGEISFDVA